MAMDSSSAPPNLSICCQPDRLYPPESFCYVNVSTANDDSTIIGEIFESNFWITPLKPEEIVPRYGLPCLDQLSISLNLSPTAGDFTFFLMEFGAIFMTQLKNIGDQFMLSKEDYCLRSYPTEDGRKIGVIICPSWILSHMWDQQELAYHKKMLYFNIMCGLSLPFLAATFLVYTILPELRNIHGSIVRTYVACLSVVFSCVIIAGSNLELLRPYIWEIFIQFCQLACFFWLNVMSFDIWLNFRSLQANRKHRNRKKFMFYSIYAFGMPVLIAGVGAVIDAIPDLPVGVIRTGLTGNHYFKDKTAQFVYLDGPIAVTILCNVCFFVLTVKNMMRHEKDTAGCLEGSDSQRHTEEKQRFKLYLKLFIIMGTTWMIELIAPLLVLSECTRAIIILPNALQGFIIFLLCVWNDKTKRLLLQRLGWRRK